MKRETTKKMLAKKKLQAAAVLAACLLLATGLAGCSSAEAATASQLQPSADKEAKKWDENAQLVTIVGTEGTVQMQSMMDQWSMADFESEALDETMHQDFWKRIEDDPVKGDGAAEFWLYVYRSGDGENHLVVVVDKEHEAVYKTESEGSDLGVPVGEYSIDSDEAMRIAREENEHLAQASEMDYFGFVIALYREIEAQKPRWIVAGGGGGAEGGGGGMVIIDALDGGVVQNEGGSGAPDDWA